MNAAIESLESRQFLSSTSGILGEYHGVLRFEDSASRVLQVGSTAKSGAVTTTRVILRLSAQKKNGTITGTLKAGALGDFSVTGKTRGSRLSLVMNHNDSAPPALAASTATFSAPQRSDGKLRGSFVQSINSATVTGSMRLNFVKAATTSTSSSASLDTSVTAGQGSTPDISGTNPTSLQSSTPDISGTTPAGTTGALDISGTNPASFQGTTPDISGTMPAGTTGAPDISGSNSNNGSSSCTGSVFNPFSSFNSSSFVSIFGGSVVFFG